VCLLHGFDSSLLEFRRLLPLLEAKTECGLLVPDLHGCGFTSAAPGDAVTPETRRKHLYDLWAQHVRPQPMVLVGASLGGAAAIDFAVRHPECVAAVVLVDAQAFVEGTPQLPGFLADLGLDLLRSVWCVAWTSAIRVPWLTRTRLQAASSCQPDGVLRQADICDG